LGVALKERDEAGLRAGRAAAAKKADGSGRVVQLLEVEQQVLQPQGRALAHGRELRWLEMGVAETGHGGVAVGKIAEIAHDGQQLSAQIAQRVAVEDEIGVVGHIAARCAQMDDALRARRHLAEAVDVRHDVVADLLFLGRDHVVVDGAHVGRELVHLRLRDGQAELVLGLRQRHPEPPPGLKPRVGGKQVQHVLRGVARAQRAFKDGLHCAALSGR